MPPSPYATSFSLRPRPFLTTPLHVRFPDGRATAT
eukprot:CAMPEP_0174853766 /NCGR_PEP_ID=MMETSP1114-20130205/29562_1 /TAXON_ID=312471 /ORGANISM="Neobodo designis, Strain CCAP 1951/1" /LENGTH=34 /DNA_ID= /DNA_START= /DNA_END= /DNA_ORIENTATION=